MKTTIASLFRLAPALAAALLLAGSPVALFDALHRSMRCFRAFCDDLYAAALSRADVAPVAAE